jgi:hypothetical protein
MRKSDELLGPGNPRVSVPSLSGLQKILPFDIGCERTRWDDQRVAVNTDDQYVSAVSFNASDVSPTSLAGCGSDGCLEAFRVQREDARLGFETDLRPQGRQHHACRARQERNDRKAFRGKVAQVSTVCHGEPHRESNEHVESPQSRRSSPFAPIPMPDFGARRGIGDCVHSRVHGATAGGTVRRGYFTAWIGSATEAGTRIANIKKS